MNIYVGNLPYDLSEDEIKTMFGEFGEVSTVTLITDRESGRPKGFGFVEMADEAQGQAAIAALNGKEIKGRTVRVDKAEPRTERPRALPSPSDWAQAAGGAHAPGRRSCLGWAVFRRAPCQKRDADNDPANPEAAGPRNAGLLNYPFAMG